MPPHKSRIGEFKMAKAVDRKVPTRLDLATNQYIHLSVRSQPASHLRNDVQAVLHLDAIFPQLKPLEQSLQGFWPAPSMESAITPVLSPTISPKSQDPPKVLKSQQAASAPLSGLPAPPDSSDLSRPPTPSSIASFTDNGSPPPSPSSLDWPPLPADHPRHAGFRALKMAARKWRRLPELQWQREQQRGR
ncbi:hypothetical protein JCM1841_001215 [Sporobolomyces salmonicolor]